jgi:hypothetical protein
MKTRRIEKEENEGQEKEEKDERKKIDETFHLNQNYLKLKLEVQPHPQRNPQMTKCLEKNIAVAAHVISCVLVLRFSY